MGSSRQEELVEAARIALNEGRLDAAERFALEGINLEPSRVPVHALLVLGTVQVSTQRHAEAARLLEPLCQMPQLESNYHLYRVLCYAYWGLGQRDKSIQAGSRAIDIDPGDLALHDLVWNQKVRRGDSITLEDMSSFVPLLQAQPIQSGLVLYRIYAMMLSASGQFDRACEVYFPFLDLEILRDGPRRAWYNWSKVEESDEVAGQSQRFGAAGSELDREMDYVLTTLAIDPEDRVLDIGGAGGLVARRLAPVASRVLLTDVSDNLVRKARANLESFPNVDCMLHDIVLSPVAGEFDKVLMASVTPVFSNLAALESALRNLHTTMVGGGRCLVSNNFDIATARSAAAHQFHPENVKTSWNALFILESMLWLDIPRVRKLASEIGFREFALLNERTLPDKRGMFDFLLVK